MNEDIQVKAEVAFAKEFNHTLHAFIDIADDLIAGTLLSQIVYWFTNDKDGRTKLRVKKKDGLWLVKSRTDWYDEIRISAKQYDRAVKILLNKGLVETKLYRFNNQPTTHIRPVWENLKPEMDKWKQDWIEKEASKSENITDLPKGEIGILPKGKLELSQRGNPLTENTTESTNKDYTFDYCNITFSYVDGKSEIVNDSFDFNVVERQVEKYCKDNSQEQYKDELIHTLKYFFESYRRTFGKDHFRLSQDKIEEVSDALLMCQYDYMGCFNTYSFEMMIDGYFQTKFTRKCNYSILHFITDGVMNNLYYKFVYNVVG